METKTALDAWWNAIVNLGDRFMTLFTANPVLTIGAILIILALLFYDGRSKEQKEKDKKKFEEEQAVKNAEEEKEKEIKAEEEAEEKERLKNRGWFRKLLSIMYQIFFWGVLIFIIRILIIHFS